jgi:hypothetical protein
MATFEPPTTDQFSDDILFGRYAIKGGVSVLWNGTTFVARPYPWLGEVVDLVEGETWFQGGRVYTVTPAVAAALNAAGFVTT